MALPAHAAPLYVPRFRGVDEDGAPLIGGKVYTYIAGTTTPLASYPTYDDALAGTNANANPVILDANGEASIYLINSLYKVRLFDANDVEQWTEDDFSPALSYAQPALVDFVPITAATTTFVSTTSFTINSVDYTFIVHAGRRLQCVCTAGTVFCTVVSSTFGGVNTTITVVCDGTSALDSGLSSVGVGFVNYANPSYLDPRTAVSVIKNGNQTGFAAQSQITAWTEEVDSNSEFATPDWTCKYPGKYLISLQAEISDTVASQLATLEILKNGSTTLRRSLSYTAPTGGNKTTPSCTCIATLAAGNTIGAFLTGTVNTTVYGTAGTALTISRIP